MSLAREERAELADLLATLTPAQWEAPSLCAGWRVRDVVAHMYSYEELGPVGLVGRFVRGGLRLDRINAAGVAAYADRSPDELLALVRDHLQPRGLTAGFGGRIALTDGSSTTRTSAAPSACRGTSRPSGCAWCWSSPAPHPPSGAKRVRGLTLVATDLDWRAVADPSSKGLRNHCSWPSRAVAESPGADRPGLGTIVARTGA
jgi:hypothetical protein